MLEATRQQRPHEEEACPQGARAWTLAWMPERTGPCRPLLDCAGSRWTARLPSPRGGCSPRLSAESFHIPAGSELVTSC